MFFLFLIAEPVRQFDKMFVRNRRKSYIYKHLPLNVTEKKLKIMFYS